MLLETLTVLWFDESKKRWTVQFPNGQLTDSGKPSKTTKRFGTEKAASRYCAELNRRIRQHGVGGDIAIVGAKSSQKSSCANDPSEGNQIKTGEAFDRYREWLIQAATSSGKAMVENHNISLSTINIKILPTLKAMVKDFGSQPLKDITIKDLEDHLDALDVMASGYNSRINQIQAFFNWCLKRRRRWIVSSPAAGLERINEEWTRPEFLPVEDVEKVFRAAEEIDPWIIADLALRFFAGLRTCEIGKLKESDIWWDEFLIDLRDDVAKRSSRNKPLPRQIQLVPDTVWNWLLAVGGENLKIDLTNRFKRVRAVFRHAGVSFLKNGGRHSAATYLLALNQNPGETAKVTGHRKISTLLNYYTGLVPKSHAEKYFNILPSRDVLVKPNERYQGRKTKIEWPNPEKLLEMLADFGGNKSALARKLGVSETAVRKRLNR